MTRETKQLPGRVIPILEEEFADFESEARAFMQGETEEAEFIGFRLKQGVYGQRQPDRQMIRVKLPFGGVTADQLAVFGDVAEKYVPLKRGHLTTRENVQYHHVLLPLATEALRLMAKVGLSTREACGNTVRNVTGDAWAGVAADEIFDPTPYAGALVRYFVRNPLTQLLPRKFKVSFTGSDTDRVLSEIHDLAFVSRIRNENGREVKGFRMLAGGGLSIFAKNTLKLYDFVPVEDYLRVTEAVLRIFERSEDLRRNRAKARIKFLIHKVGIEAFREMVDEELKGDWAKKDYALESLLFLDDEESDAPVGPADAPVVDEADRDLFERFVESNVASQRQAGYSTVEVKVNQGDLVPEQFRGLAAILSEYGAGRARVAPWQNIVLRWIPDNSLYEVWKDLRKLDLGNAGAQKINDVVSCPGTDSCKLGITSSMGLNRAVQAKVEEMYVRDPLTNQILINISGCPNSCGQHHLGNIGFHGATMKSGDRQIPAYHVFIGGNRRAGIALRIGKLLRTRLPAKRVPIAVERLLIDYEENRRDDEEPFNDYVDSRELMHFNELLADMSIKPEFSEEAEQFVDWERDRQYMLERGEGECAV